MVSSFVSLPLLAGPKIEVTPYLGKKIHNYSEDAIRFDDGKALLGIKINGFITEKISTQLAFESSKDNPMGDGGKTDIERGMLNVQYDFAPRYFGISPYVLGGWGYENLNRRAPNNVDSGSFYNLGAGLKYQINERVNIAAETRVIRKVEDQDTDVIGTLGVGYIFGKIQKVLTLQDIRERTEEQNKKDAKVSLVATPSKKSIAKVAPAEPVLSKKKSIVRVTPDAPVVATKETIVKEAPVAPIVEEKTDEIPLTETIPVATTKEAISTETETVSEEVVDTKIVYDVGEVSCREAMGCNYAPIDVRADEDVSVSSGDYYIQVMAVKSSQTDVIASRLDEGGYTYTFQEKGALTRVLVGPYESRAVAKLDLPVLKKIRYDAFIYQDK